MNEKRTYVTVRMAAAKVAKDEFTADEPAKLLSVVSMSFPNRFSIRPVALCQPLNDIDQVEPHLEA